MQLENYLFPFAAECEWHLAARIIFYLAFILWLFIGVGVASDAFSAPGLPARRVVNGACTQPP